MQPYLTPGMTRSVRRMFERAIMHTYTRIPYTYGARSGYGLVSAHAGTPATGVPCRYLPKPLIREHLSGRDTLVVPAVTDDTLLVHWNDPIKVGDYVTNIRSFPEPSQPLGRLLLLNSSGGAGQAIVISEADHAGLGPITLRRLVLRDPDEQEVYPRG